MVANDEDNEAVNVGKQHELLDERLARFDGFVGKLKEELSIASDRGSRNKTERRFDTRGKFQEKNRRSGEHRKNEDGDEGKEF